MKEIMRKRILIAVAVAIALSVAVSCGGSKSNCGTTTNDVTVQYVYVANEAAQSISGYQMSDSGVLTPLGSAVQTGGQGPHEIAFDPASKLLFVLNHLSGNISVFKVDAQSGALTAVTGSPFAAGGSQVMSMALHTSGKFLFVTDRVNGLYAFAVDTTTGALTAMTGSPFATGMTQPEHIVVHPGGKFVYVASSAAPLTVTGYDVSATNGTVQPMEAPFDLGTLTPAAISTDATGKYLLVAAAEGVLSHFDIDATTGALAENQYSPIQVPSSPEVELAVTGKFIYVLDKTDRFIDLYVVESDGKISPQDSQALNGALTPTGIAVDSGGKFVMVTDSAGATIASYAIDTTTGELTSQGPAVASAAGAAHVASGKVTKQVTTPVACDGGGGGRWQ